MLVNEKKERKMEKLDLEKLNRLKEKPHLSKEEWNSLKLEEQQYLLNLAYSENIKLKEIYQKLILDYQKIGRKD